MGKLAITTSAMPDGVGQEVIGKTINEKAVYIADQITHAFFDSPKTEMTAIEKLAHVLTGNETEFNQLMDEVSLLLVERGAKKSDQLLRGVSDTRGRVNAFYAHVEEILTGRGTGQSSEPPPAV
jgi:hypothetical protein